MAGRAGSSFRALGRNMSSGSNGGSCSVGRSCCLGMLMGTLMVVLFSNLLLLNLLWHTHKLNHDTPHSPAEFVQHFLSPYQRGTGHHTELATASGTSNPSSHQSASNLSTKETARLLASKDVRQSTHTLKKSVQHNRARRQAQEREAKKTLHAKKEAEKRKQAERERAEQKEWALKAQQKQRKEIRAEETRKSQLQRREEQSKRDRSRQKQQRQQQQTRKQKQEKNQKHKARQETRVKSRQKQRRKQQPAKPGATQPQKKHSAVNSQPKNAQQQRLGRQEERRKQMERSQKHVKVKLDALNRRRARKRVPPRVTNRNKRPVRLTRSRIAIPRRQQPQKGGKVTAKRSSGGRRQQRQQRRIGAKVTANRARGKNQRSGAQKSAPKPSVRKRQPPPAKKKDDVEIVVLPLRPTAKLKRTVYHANDCNTHFANKYKCEGGGCVSLKSSFNRSVFLLPDSLIKGTKGDNVINRNQLDRDISLEEARATVAVSSLGLPDGKYEATCPHFIQVLGVFDHCTKVPTSWTEGARPGSSCWWSPRVGTTDRGYPITDCKLGMHGMWMRFLQIHRIYYNVPDDLVQVSFPPRQYRPRGRVEVHKEDELRKVLASPEGIHEHMRTLIFQAFVAFVAAEDAIDLANSDFKLPHLVYEIVPVTDNEVWHYHMGLATDRNYSNPKFSEKGQPVDYWLDATESKGVQLHLIDYHILRHSWFGIPSGNKWHWNSFVDVAREQANDIFFHWYRVLHANTHSWANTIDSALGHPRRGFKGKPPQLVKDMERLRDDLKAVQGTVKADIYKRTLTFAPDAKKRYVNGLRDFLAHHPFFAKFRKRPARLRRSGCKVRRYGWDSPAHIRRVLDRTVKANRGLYS